MSSASAWMHRARCWTGSWTKSARSPTAFRTLPAAVEGCRTLRPRPTLPADECSHLDQLLSACRSQAVHCFLPYYGRNAVPFLVSLPVLSCVQSL